MEQYSTAEIKLDLLKGLEEGIDTQINYLERQYNASYDDSRFVDGFNGSNFRAAIADHLEFLDTIKRRVNKEYCIQQDKILATELS